MTTSLPFAVRSRRTTRAREALGDRKSLRYELESVDLEPTFFGIEPNMPCCTR